MLDRLTGWLTSRPTRLTLAVVAVLYGATVLRSVAEELAQELEEAESRLHEMKRAYEYGGGASELPRRDANWHQPSDTPWQSCTKCGMPVYGGSAIHAECEPADAGDIPDIGTIERVHEGLKRAA